MWKIDQIPSLFFSSPSLWFFVLLPSFLPSLLSPISVWNTGAPNASRNQTFKIKCNVFLEQTRPQPCVKICYCCKGLARRAHVEDESVKLRWKISVLLTWAFGEAPWWVRTSTGRGGRPSADSTVCTKIFDNLWLKGGLHIYGPGGLKEGGWICTQGNLVPCLETFLVVTLWDGTTGF